VVSWVNPAKEAGGGRVSRTDHKERGLETPFLSMFWQNPLPWPPDPYTGLEAILRL